MKKTKTYAKKTLSVFMAIMMLMTAWVFVAPEKAEAGSATTIAGTNTTKLQELNGLDFGTGFTTVSGNFHGDNATETANKGIFKNTLYSPHFPASNNNLTNDDAGVYFGTLGSTADGARVWYPETTLIHDGVTTPQIGLLFDIDSNNNNRVGVKNVYISSGANGLSFPDAYWTAKSECAKDTNYYTHFTFNWIMNNKAGNYWISTSSGNDKESMCSTKGYWDIYATYLQYTGGAFGSGSTYYKAITPTWVCRTGSNYTGTTNETIYVIDYVPLKNALASVQGIINSINSTPAKYTTASVAAFVDAAKKLVAAKPNNYINASDNNVSGWNTAVSSALSAWNSAKNLAVQNYTLEFKNTDNQVVYTQTYPYGTAVNCTSIAADLGNTIKQIAGDDGVHQTYKWDDTNFVTTITDDVTITETPTGTVAHTYGSYTQGDTTHSRTCSVCGYVETKSHVEDNGTVDREETCTVDGIKTYDCNVCGKTDIRTETINKITGHDFSGEIMENATGENGTHWRKCVRFEECGTYGWPGLGADGCENHDWDKDDNGVVDAKDAETKASTCKEAGYEKYTCKVCSATWTKELELAAHKTTATAAKDVTNTCGGDGNAAFWTCTVCERVWKDAALTDEDEVLDKTDADNDGIPDVLETKGPDHDFSGACVNKSNGADGEHYRQCKRFTTCGAYGLNVDNGDGTTTPTVGATEKHNFTSETVDSTCTAAGKTTYTCSDCKHSYIETLPLAAHKMTKHEAVEAKCNVPGSIEYYSCSECNKNYSDEAGTDVVTNTATSALTHKWSAHHDYDTLKTAATCMDAAVYNNHCDYCKEKLTGTHSYGNPDTETGHNFNGDIQQNADGSHSYKCLVEGCDEYGKKTTCTFTTVKEDVASTCCAYGYTIYECTICKAENRVEKTVLDSDNHEGETELRFASEAKCNTDGYTGDTYCLGCKGMIEKGEKITADKTVHPHEDMKTYEAQASTCQVEGWKEYKYCSACGTYDVAKETVPVRAHTFKDYTPDEDADTHTAVCATCDATVATPVTDTKPCAGGKANCVDLAVCTTCKGTYGKVDDANHKVSEFVAKVDSTCQTEGTEAYRKCTACNTNIDTPVAIEKKAHIFGAWTKIDGEDKHTRSCTTCKAEVGDGIVTETADCNGGTAYCNKLAECKDCKAEYGTFDAANHSTEANTLKDVIDATCQAEGFSGNYRYNCCDAIKVAGTVTEKLAHTFDIEVEGSKVDATCIAKGEVTYKCSTCVETEDVKAATYKKELPIDSNNHATPEETVIKNQKAATCEEDGHTGDVYYKCCYVEGASAADNKKALKEKGTTIKANGQHVYGDAIPEYMIERIDETKDEEGNVISKTIVLKAEAPDYEGKIAARRDDDKWYHVQQCEICGIITYSACYTYAHTYNCVDTDKCEVCEGLCSLKDENKHDNIVTIEKVEATHTNDGTKEYYKCADCGKFFLDDAGKKNFDPTSEAGKALITISKDTVPCTDWEKEPFETRNPTCGEDGYKKYHCTIEGCNKVKTEVIPATSDSHNWSTEYKVIKEPTCGSVGYKSLYCTECNVEKPNSTVTVAATGEHTYELADIKEGSSCIDPTVETWKCSVCGAEKEEIVYEDNANHQWGDWVTTGGDCSTGILQERECSVCHEKERRTETTNTHEMELTLRVEPTAAKDGYEIYKCKNCGVEERKELPYQGSGEGGETPDTPEDKHVIIESDFTVVESANCEHGEIRRYVCLRCGETVEKEVGEPTDHVWLLQPAEIATCTKDGHREYYRCVRCLAAYEDGKGEIVIKKLDHEDRDGDGKCDGCNSAFYSKGTCGCICHKESGFMKFIYKIINFFWKLFKISRTCDCGATHY